MIYVTDPALLRREIRRTHFENSIMDALSARGHTPYREIGHRLRRPEPGRHSAQDAVRQSHSRTGRLGPGVIYATERAGDSLREALMTDSSAPGPALPPDWLVLVVNLDRRPDRLALMSERLGAQGIAFERLPAVDARAPDFAERAAHLPRHGAVGSIGDGMLACNLSHARAWERIVGSGAAAGVVLEDDALLSAGFAEFLGALAAVRLDLPLVKLERFRNERGVFLEREGATVAGRRVARLRSLHTGSAAYVISAEGARTALARFPGNTLPIDHFLFNPVAGSLFSTLGPRQVVPALVVQDGGAGGSDTSGTRQVRQFDRWSRTKYHLRRGVNESAAFLRILPAILAGRIALRRITVA